MCDADEGWSISAIGAYRFPDSEDAMTWRIRDHGLGKGGQGKSKYINGKRDGVIGSRGAVPWSTLYRFFGMVQISSGGFLPLLIWTKKLGLGHGLRDRGNPKKGLFQRKRHPTPCNTKPMWDDVG